MKIIRRCLHRRNGVDLNKKEKHFTLIYIVQIKLARWDDTVWPSISETMTNKR